MPENEYGRLELDLDELIYELTTVRDSLGHGQAPVIGVINMAEYEVQIERVLYLPERGIVVLDDGSMQYLSNDPHYR